MLCRADLEDDIAAFIRERVPAADLRIVFDVGANVGWFTYQFAISFPLARFHLFEPVAVQFDAIPATLRLAPERALAARSIVNRMALGHVSGEVVVTALPGVTINHVIDPDAAAPPPAWPTQTAPMLRGDEYCAMRGIDHIDFLKIDAEGYDMNVLIGFTAMLAAARIDFVQVEASLARDNTEQIHIDRFTGFLEGFGYRCFRIVNQASGPRIPYLTRADIVFIREAFARTVGRDAVAPA